MGDVIPSGEREPTLRDLQEQVLEFSARRDWTRFHAPGELSKALIVEAAELLELSLWSESGELTSTRERAAGEMADVQIYLLHLADALDIDLGEAVLEKMKQNAERFPEKD